MGGGQRDGVSVCVWGDVCGDVCGGVVWGVDVDVCVCGCVLNYVMCVCSIVAFLMQSPMFT